MSTQITEIHLAVKWPVLCVYTMIILSITH